MAARGCRSACTAMCFLAALVVAGNASLSECQFPDGDTGMMIDLTPLSGQNWLVADATGTYYYLINPCKTLHYDHNMPEGNGVCFSDSRACQLSTDRTPLTLVAKNFSSGTLAESGMAILLTGGTICSAYNNKPREAIITLTCSSNIGQPVFVAEAQCTYTFTWATSAACRVPVSDGGDSGATGLSGGDIFLILFFGGGAAYLVLGYAYMFVRHGARGAEAVPHIELWRGLPGLVKDGFAFTFHRSTACCRDTTQIP